ncbi:MAG TPA: hypothetical protein VFU93_08395 [Acidimicrobiales bacterium]|nr:hypothetical protein [Acidimicrobiales bacterium]
MTVTDAPPQELPPSDEPDQPPPRRGLALPPWLPVHRLVTALTLLGAVGFTFWQLHPSLLLADTTPAGGDMGAHVWAPAFLRDHLLPSLRLTGWTQDWYAGFPAFHFYMVLPSLAIVVLDVLLPYGVAFKLVAVSGLLALPVALYAFGRLARLPFPGPQLLAVAGVPFLFDRSFSIYGGNVPSTLAGEFAFSISLALAVVFLGVVLRGVDTGRHRALAAGLFALTALCHLIPAVFAIVGALVAVGMRYRPATRTLVAGLAALVFIALDIRLLALFFAVVAVGLIVLDHLREDHRSRGWWLISTGIAAGALTAWWTLPFYLRHAYLNDMGWEKIHFYVENLFPGRIGTSLTRLFGGEATANVPGDLTWVVVFAAVGVGVSIALRRRVGIYLGVVGLVFAVGFVVMPQSRLWNARLLPFWYLCLYLLAALAIYEIAHALAVLLAKDVQRPLRSPIVAAPLVALFGVLAFLGMALRALPGGDTSADGATYSWLGMETTDRSYIPDWGRWNFSGYERKDAYPEFENLVSTMARLGEDPEHGCGRAMWEYESQLDRFGTPMALMLLPYFTDECIGSMEGLYFEASATTPYHFLNQSELSTAPSNAQRDLRYQGLNVDLGVQHLQLMGVKYYMAFSESAVNQAQANEDLTEVATSDGWHIYEVADAPMVESVTALPAVVTDVSKGGRDWQDMAEDWYLDPSQWDVLRSVSGPKEWPRIREDEDAPTRSVRPVSVSNIDQGTSTVSFDVSDVGTPVLVKTSYFPSWEVSGADGPWRVAPNFMVVVPTDEHVELRYGRQPIEWFSWLLTFAGIALVVLLWRRPALEMPDDLHRPWRWRLRLEKVEPDPSGVDTPEAVAEVVEPEPRT